MKNFTKYRIKDSLSTTMLMAIIFLIINLVFEIAIVDEFRGLGFSKGYITVSGQKVGYHVISYLVAISTGFGALFYSSKRSD